MSEEPEEAILENWRKLLSTEKFCSVLEKLQIMWCQQNEKYPFAFKDSYK